MFTVGIVVGTRERDGWGDKVVGKENRRSGLGECGRDQSSFRRRRVRIDSTESLIRGFLWWLDGDAFASPFV